MKTSITSDGIQQFLSAEVGALKMSGVRTSIGGYVSMSDFVLRNGIEMEFAPLPKGVQLGRMKECYRNASLLASFPRLKERFIYCEGYAAGVIPVMHAWVYDLQTGKVVDPTWQEGHQYFGIVFKNTYMMRMALRCKTYGIIDQWTEGWPVLTDDPKEWRHPVMDKLKEAA